MCCVFDSCHIPLSFSEKSKSHHFAQFLSSQDQDSRLSLRRDGRSIHIHTLTPLIHFDTWQHMKPDFSGFKCAVSKKNVESYRIDSRVRGHIITYHHISSPIIDISSIKSEESQQGWEFAESEIESFTTFTVFLLSGMAIWSSRSWATFNWIKIKSVSLGNCTSNAWRSCGTCGSCLLVERVDSDYELCKTKTIWLGFGVLSCATFHLGLGSSWFFWA